MDSLVYTIKDIMKILNISKSLAYDLIKLDEFPVLKIKTAYRIPKKSFDEWINKSKTA